MVVHQVFAHILDTKIKNVIVCDNYEIANQLARATYGPTAIGVECTQYRVGIGDYFIDNVFYHADPDDPEKVGQMAQRVNTAEEDAYEANMKVTSANDQLAAMQVETAYLAALSGVEDEVYNPAADTALNEGGAE